MRIRLPRIFGFTATLGTAGAGLAAVVTLAVRLRHAGLAIGAGIVGLLYAAAASHFVRKLVRWQATIWVPTFLTERRTRVLPSQPLDVLFVFCDHYEPHNEGVGTDQQIARVRRWEKVFRGALEGHEDSDGRPPQHTWFYPVALTAAEVHPLMARWPGLGWGEIEYHLHHDPSFDEQQIRQQIVEDVRRLQGMGAVTSGRYGFVHGDFALAGSDPRYCNAPNEIDVLLDTGCYADFTFPALETPAQPRRVNTLFYARSTGGPKPYDEGDLVQVGKAGSGLLIFQGPMWAGWSWRVLDEAHVAPTDPPHPHRIRHWLDAHVHVRGRPNWVFIAVHSHTAKEPVQDMLFAGPMQRLWSALETRFKSANARLHYVTAREAFNIAKAAEAGHDGNPHEHRDYLIPPPANRRHGGGAGNHRPSKSIP